MEFLKQTHLNQLSIVHPKMLNHALANDARANSFLYRKVISLLPKPLKKLLQTLKNI
jgi:hypothetical protein